MAVVSISILFFAVLCGGTVYLHYKPTESVKATSSSLTFSFLALCVIALIVRLWLTLNFDGFPADISCFSGWGLLMSEHGLADFYQNADFCDYPPLYLTVLGMAVDIAASFGVHYGNPLFDIFLRLPVFLSDIAVSALLYHILTKSQSEKVDRSRDRMFALLVSAVYLFNPAVIYNGGVWGQMDGVIALFWFVIVYLLVSEKFMYAIPVFVLSLLVKPHGILLSIVMLLAGLHFLYNWYTKSRKTVDILPAVISGLLSVTFFFVISVVSTGSIFGIVELYLSTLSYYGYASLSAFSFASMLGGQWADTSRAVFTTMPWLTFDLMLTVLTVLSIAVPSYLFFKYGMRIQSLSLIAPLMVTLLCTFGSGVHERYAMPTIALWLLAFCLNRDVRLLLITAAISVLNYVNTWAVLDLFLQTESYPDPNSALLSVGSFATVAVTLYALYVVINIMSKEYLPLKPSGTKPNTEEKNTMTTTTPFRITKLDILLMVILTFGYMVIAIPSLGDMKAPESYWAPSEGEQVVVELRSDISVSGIKYFHANGVGSFIVERSIDGVNWLTSLHIQALQGQEFQWHDYELDLGGATNYLRFTAVIGNLKIGEIGLYTDSGELYDIHSVTPLFDEQELVPDRPSYMNSMYFDEIYFGLSAYETLHDLPLYETTHPPLGKNIMALGIAIYGMNPFGYRIMSLLFSALILPAMYVLGKALFKSSGWAVVLASLMLLDGMHLTLGRMGTTDSILIFFILVSYTAMYIFSEMSMSEDKPLTKQYIALGISGLALGLAIATKWIGLYSAPALAVWFFYLLYKKYDAKQSRVYFKNVFKVCLFCVGAFVFVPLTVYLLSYLPFMSIYPEENWLSSVWNNQIHMFSYHTGLTEATHPFESRWYTWWLGVQPLWLYVGSGLESGMLETILCMGNPVLWWASLSTAVPCALSLVTTSSARIKSKKAAENNRIIAFCFFGLFANILPWLFVERLTFNYHFYASLPFALILLTVAMRGLHRFVTDRFGAKPATLSIIAIMAVFAVTFAAFYPIYTGTHITLEYAQTLHWFPNWYFGV